MAEIPQSSDATTNPERLIKLSETQEEIRQTAKPDLNSEVCCDVCLRMVVLGEMITLPCDHMFHCKCIIKWLELAPQDGGNGLCPYCRYRLFYSCNALPSRRLLRPGVKIMKEELTFSCPLYNNIHEPLRSAQGDLDDYPPGNVSPPSVPWSVGRAMSSISSEGQDENPDEAEPGVADPDERLPLLGEQNEPADDEIPPDEPLSPNRNTPEQDEPADENDILLGNLQVDENIPAGEEAPADQDVPEDELVVYGPLPDNILEAHNRGHRPRQEHFKLWDLTDPDSSIGRPAPGEVPRFTKGYVACALDHDWVDAMEEAIQNCFDMAICYGWLLPTQEATVRTTHVQDVWFQYKTLHSRLAVFREEHHGIIQLNEVAIAYRDSEEAAMRAALDRLWDIFKFVVNKLGEMAEVVQEWNPGNVQGNYEEFIGNLMENFWLKIDIM
ncbi:hypothetical protein F5B20DRAFT_584391 [Whalleya microplaca]|nr:hypothetical protein F5B20DRAFT_584391 [Whalleya microplaca]